MSDADAFALFREGALFGMLGGVLLTLCAQEAVRGFKHWLRQLAQERANALRCRKTWECLDDDGHDGECVNVKECD